MQAPFFQVSPQVEAANKISTVGDLILLMPHAYAKLDCDQRDNFYGVKALDEDYQRLVQSDVNAAFDESYLPKDDGWRGRYIANLKARALALDESDRDRMGLIISVFEAVIARNHLPKHKDYRHLWGEVRSLCADYAEHDTHGFVMPRVDFAQRASELFKEVPAEVWAREFKPYLLEYLSSPQAPKVRMSYADWCRVKVHIHEGANLSRHSMTFESRLSTYLPLANMVQICPSPETTLTAISSTLATTLSDLPFITGIAVIGDSLNASAMQRLATGDLCDRITTLHLLDCDVGRLQSWCAGYNNLTHLKIRPSLNTTHGSGACKLSSVEHFELDLTHFPSKRVPTPTPLEEAFPALKSYKLSGQSYAHHNSAFWWEWGGSIQEHPNLTHLDFSECHFEGGVLPQTPALLSAPPKLTHFKAAVSLHEEDFRAEWVSRLEVLDLRGCQDPLEKYLDNPRLDNLKWLGLGDVLYDFQAQKNRT